MTRWKNPRTRVIGEKRPRKDFASSPSKKGKVVDHSKGKEVAPTPEAKKKATRHGDMACSRVTSSPKPVEGTSTNLSTALGPIASILGSLSMAEKILRGVILPTVKEKMEKHTLDQMATRLFHQSLVLGSSLAVQSRKARKEASLQQGRAAFLESKAKDDTAKLNEDRDAVIEKLERSGILVVELQETMAWAKTFLRQHHPDLVIDLEGMGLDHDLLTEEDEAGEEEKEKEGENKEDGGKDKGNANPFPP
ncbi:hypothetical protein Acr_00g0053620 [Actinidia rufa]|uniref:Uncharacterized protein n=1 Tax=Actinidia rufa TaxID=165716 RepID=A0A7J0DMW3_9ERIC|nr:hypothetical protein Acr_00g0053620 [Actinidia rufa]